MTRKLIAELEPVEVCIIDDTGFPKKGKRSVGVARQYSGTLGKVDNCQVALRYGAGQLPHGLGTVSAPKAGWRIPSAGKKPSHND